MTSPRNCLGCQYYVGDNKCNIFPWMKDHYVKVNDPTDPNVCPNFIYKEANCDICGKPINPYKLLMAWETVSRITQLKRLGLQGIETRLPNGKYIIHCVKCIPKNYYWGEKEEEENV